MKHILIIISLIFSLNVFTQNTTQISLLHKNGGRQNSKIKMNFGFVIHNDSTTIYCDIYNKKFEKKITFKEYDDIIKLVKKISSFDILSRDDLYLDASDTTITLQNMQSSVSFSISGLQHNDSRKEYLHFKNAVEKILNAVELHITDLR